MYRYILKRLVMMVPVLIGVLIVVFIIIELTPGDPASIMLGDDASIEAIENLRESLGLNDPMPIRFVNYVGDVARLNFGISYQTRQSVSDEIFNRFPATFTLAALSASVSLIIGMSMGVISAIKQYSKFDTISTGIALFGVSMPNFWQGLMSIIVFAVWLEWLPASGSYGMKYWILPAATLGTSAAATIMRMTRSSMLEVIRQDYIRTAQAKGQLEIVVVIKHALRNALIPVVTVAGMQFGVMLGGSVLIETIFSIPGLGSYMVDAIRQRDFPVVQGGVLFLALSFSVVNLLVDILYGFIDPRIKSQYSVKKKQKVNVEAKKALSERVSRI